MDRLVKANVIAKSGHAVEAAGDVDTMPMADRSPPIVVWISVTKSATRNTTGIDAPENSAKGLSVTTTSRKIRVKPVSKMVSAISFGAFDHRDHPVEEAAARLSGRLDHQPVGDYPSAAPGFVARA